MQVTDGPPFKRPNPDLNSRLLGRPLGALSADLQPDTLQREFTNDAAAAVAPTAANSYDPSGPMRPIRERRSGGPACGTCRRT
jgi:hypothetical protein